jgi:hypothetical protein
VDARYLFLTSVIQNNTFLIFLFIHVTRKNKALWAKVRRIIYHP